MENNETGSQHNQLTPDRDSIYNWIKTDAKVQQYLEQFSTTSVESLMTTYSSMKVNFMKDGDAFASIAERRDEAGIVAAQELLLQIQQKKFFDIFCMWNAEAVTHDDYKCSWDFVYQEGHLTECSLLTPALTLKRTRKIICRTLKENMPVVNCKDR